MSPRDSDRLAVLQRRALFVGSALATLGSCARSTSPAEHAESPVVVVPDERSDAGESSGELADAALPPRKEPTSSLGDMPPLEAPDGVPDSVRERYERLARVMTDAHRAVDDITSGVPSCDVTSCEAQWRALATKVYELDGLFRFFFVCPGSSADAKAYGVRAEAHQQYYSERRARMDEKIATALGGAAARKRWEELLREAGMANPMPCLSFACVDW